MSLAAAADTVLLLHGQPGSASDWDRVQASVGERVPLVAIDRPGWGPAGAAVDLAGNAEFALAALAQRGVAEPVTVAGFSFGAAVAAWLAASYPAQVRRLVLIAPAANCASLVPLDRWLAQPLAGELIGGTVLAGMGLALWPATVRRRAAQLLSLEERYLDAMARTMRNPEAWLAFAAEQRALVRELPALEARLGQITAPTSIVAGGADRVVPLASSRALAEAIPGASLTVVPGAGHLLLQRRAAEVAKAIVAAAGR